MSSIPAGAAGTYVLILALARPRRIEVGRLGPHLFPPGGYAYVGSALGPGGLRARVGRHLGAGGRLRWHIDYLRRAAHVRQVWTGLHNRRLEHRWASILARTEGAAIPAARFGASDCRCPAHLFRFPDIPSFTEFKKRAMMLSSETGGMMRIRIPQGRNEHGTADRKR